MVTKFPNSRVRGSSASSPKARQGRWPNLPRLRDFLAIPGGTRVPPHFPPQPGPIPREPGAVWLPPTVEVGPFPPLGIPLNIREAARMIGCSPWTVRQTLIPRGLPVFRSGASGKLIFYRDQVVRWIEKIQGGN
jgi:hypothetical protein